jgi:CBS domain containing-hemolysin-like protein
LNLDFVFWTAIASFGLSVFSAISAKSLTAFSRRELEDRCRRRNAAPRLSEVLRLHDEVALSAETLQVLSTVLFVWLAIGWFSKAVPVSEESATWVDVGQFCGLVLLVLLGGVWIPHGIAKLAAAGFVYHTWPFWRAAEPLLRPLIWGAEFWSIVLHRLAGRMPEVADEESFEDEIRTIVTEGHREGLLEEDAREMIEGVIELSDVSVSEVMTPRTDTVSLSASLSWEELLEFIVNSPHSRIPVHEKNRDDIIGVLHIKDLLQEIIRKGLDRTEPWANLAREPYFVPETKPIHRLLEEFQRTQNHLAVVLDEYGGVSGVVSMEDILEEIVGEIDDEYDQAMGEEIRIIADGVAEVLGRVHVDEVNEELGLNLPEEGDYDTIAGLVFSELGHVPVVGEELICGSSRITVLEATKRRILRLQIETEYADIG